MHGRYRGDALDPWTWPILWPLGLPYVELAAMELACFLLIRGGFFSNFFFLLPQYNRTVSFLMVGPPRSEGSFNDCTKRFVVELTQLQFKWYHLVVSTCYGGVGGGGIFFYKTHTQKVHYIRKPNKWATLWYINASGIWQKHNTADMATNNLNSGERGGGGVANSTKNKNLSCMIRVQSTPCQPMSTSKIRVWSA